MRYYLFLPGGYPEAAREDDSERIERLARHPLVGVYDSWAEMERVWTVVQDAAHERIRKNGYPNLPVVRQSLWSAFS